MSELEDLYKSLHKLKEIGATIDDRLISKIQKEEDEIINNKLIPAISQAIDSASSDIQRGLSI